MRPVRWRGLPRRRTLLRVTAVAVLLGLAAAVFQTPGGCPAGPARVAAPTTGAPPGAAPTLPAGAVGVPVRLAEPAALAVLRPGVRVDLLVVPAGGSADPTVIAPRALVLDVVGVVEGSSALYLALPPEQARRAVGLPEGSRFAVVVRG
ncbi:hypothetical protein GCM10022379_04170 [Micromonospora maritima]